MDVWNGALDDLWPDEEGEPDSGMSYLRALLDEANVQKLIALRLIPDLGAECATALQTDWEMHYRFTFALLAAFAFAPDDPAQWFVDIGLNRQHQKARDVLNNIAIVERRLAVMMSLLPERSAPVEIDSLAREWIKIQLLPGWELGRWVMQLAVGLREADQHAKAASLVKQLPPDSLELLYRYAAALELLTAAGRQAVTEAIERLG